MSKQRVPSNVLPADRPRPNEGLRNVVRSFAVTRKTAATQQRRTEAGMRKAAKSVRTGR